MSPLETFPPRLLKTDEVNRIRNVDGVHCLHVGAHMGPGHDPMAESDVADFVIFLDRGLAVTAQLNPETATWSCLAAIEANPADTDDHDRALEHLNDVLDDGRGDLDRYGQALAVEFGELAPEDADLYDPDS